MLTIVMKKHHDAHAFQLFALLFQSKKNLRTFTPKQKQIEQQYSQAKRQVSRFVKSVVSKKSGFYDSSFPRIQRRDRMIFCHL